MFCKKTELLEFLNAVCEDYASEHATDICEILSYTPMGKLTASLILNIFKRLYENEEYWAMTQLVLCIYDLDVQIYPSSIVLIQAYEISLQPYCDWLMNKLDQEITAFIANSPH